MSHSEGTVTSLDGLEIYYQCWHPATPAHAILGIVHGLGSHSGLFDNVVNALVPQGYAVYGIDLRGHGRSPGQRGYIDRWDDYRNDLHSFWQQIAAQNPGLPRFCMGHSLGAIVLLDYALHHGEMLNGIITMAPIFQAAGVPPIRIAIGQMMSWVWPRFALNTGIPRNACSHDPAIVEAYNTNPLRHTKGTARLATEFLKTSAWVQAHIGQLQMPLLTLHGSDDIVALPDCSRFLMAQAGSADKDYRYYLGGCHDLHIDTCTAEVMADLVNWLDRQVKPQTSLPTVQEQLVQERPVQELSSNLPQHP
ncbi:MAG TPA: lysophospholipase [Chroococcidiopsis sp.]